MVFPGSHKCCLPQRHTDKIAVCRLQWLVAGPNLFRIAIAVLGSSCSKSRQVMAAVEATVGQPDDDGGPKSSPK